MIIDGTLGATFNDGSLQAAAASPFSLKNRIINGDMVIDQRNAGASVTPTAVATWNYTIDRWAALISVTSKFSVQQNAGSVTPPAGFTNYLGVTSLSAYSISSGDYFWLEQPIEGYNTSDLAWGTANAKTITLSFWVRSSLTGTFGGSLTNAGNNYAYPFSYTISSANTWTQISITIAGPTAGTWNTTNSQGIRVRFGLGVGSSNSGTAGAWAAVNYVSATGAVSVVGTNAATFYVTGVQLERNTTATPFEWLPYSTELQLCQRYYYRIQSQSTYNPYGTGWNRTTSLGLVNIQHPTTMRRSPTSIDYSLLSSTVLGISEALVSTASLSTNDYGGTNMVSIDITSSALFTTGFMTLTAKASTSSYLGFSAEL
jgi:hypothetical protein